MHPGLQPGDALGEGSGRARNAGVSVRVRCLRRRAALERTLKATEHRGRDGDGTDECVWLEEAQFVSSTRPFRPNPPFSRRRAPTSNLEWGRGDNLRTQCAPFAG